jgi:hypothetical protein
MDGLGPYMAGRGLASRRAEGVEMNYELSQHARDVLQERHIPVEWMERVIGKPALVEASATDPMVESRLAQIPEHGNRVLRVVINKTVVPQRVVSVYFDRTMKGKL